MRVLISLQNRPLTMRIKEVMGKMKGFFSPFLPTPLQFTWTLVSSLAVTCPALFLHNRILGIKSTSLRGLVISAGPHQSLGFIPSGSPSVKHLHAWDSEPCSARSGAERTSRVGSGGDRRLDLSLLVFWFC